MPHLSIISPVYNAGSVLKQLVDRIGNATEEITDDFEIILVDDCSTDNSWKIIEMLAEENKFVKGFKLSRNFGQHYAITAGLDHAKAEWVVVMDCDLQDRPEEIPNLYSKALEGYDMVMARRNHRKDPFLKRISSVFFYKLLGFLTDTDQDSKVANFGIYHHKVISEICKMSESIRHFPTMIRWVGFKATKLDVSHGLSGERKSSYNLRKSIHLALNVLLTSSDRPINLLIVSGLAVSSVAVLFAAITALRWFFGEISVSGYASIIISIWFLAGVIIAALGIIGLYVGKIFESAKNRPHYIIDKKTS